MTGKPKVDARWHNGAESRLMAERDGWCMVRRPGCVPYTILALAWEALPSVAEGRRLEEQYRAALGSNSTREEKR